MDMERRAASHTEEEEMNQRRKLLNAARRGDTKAIGKLFELYQVRVLSGEQLVKVNKSSAYLMPVAPAKGGRSGGKGKAVVKGPVKGAKQEPAKPAKVEPARDVKVSAKKSAVKPAPTATGKKAKAADTVKKPKTIAKHK
jgi:hypothetical protein